jgi:hypothetical protein
MASSDRPFLIPVDCYAGMFGEPADILTGWGREADVLPTPTPVPDYAAVAAAQHETLTRVMARRTELLKKHGRS